MAQPGCSVVVLSYNTRELTRKCLSLVIESGSHLKKKGLGFEVIVVDNASTDGSPDMISADFPEAVLLKQDRNLGFARGNNKGMSGAKYDLILLLNSDALVSSDTLSRLSDSFNRHPGWDILGCRLTFGDGRFQPSGGFLPDPGNIVFWMTGLDKIPGAENFFRPVHPAREAFFANDRELGWVTGAFFALRRRVFDTTGGFDENYHMYMEEVEWCRRIRDADFTVGYTSSFSVTHLGQASSSSGSVSSLIKEMKGLFYYLQKYYPGSVNRIRIVAKLGMTMRLLAFTLLGKTSRAASCFRILRSI